jgi:hypothetical protein
MTDRLTDQFFIHKIFESSGVDYYPNDLKDILRNIIEELCLSHKHLMPKLRLEHIDRAIFKYRQVKDKKIIRNTKQYIKACILSAIYELGLEELMPID